LHGSTCFLCFIATALSSALLTVKSLRQKTSELGVLSLSPQLVEPCLTFTPLNLAQPSLCAASHGTMDLPLAYLNRQGLEKFSKQVKLKAIFKMFSQVNV
jgi:hypothetical protein